MILSQKRKNEPGQDKNKGGQVENNEVMTVDEVAGMLKLCKNTVYEYVKKGKIPGARVGKMLRFTKRQVMEALEAGFPVRSKGDTHQHDP